jgi:ATP-dependent HslUV protease ATP-binding subunit HslU
MTDIAVAQDTESAAPPPPWLEEMPPRQIVSELDRYIVGQDAAKKAVAIAVRNRWRRAQAPDDIRDEITPYNIILIGPTGVGKTEVARRLARLAGAPFIKVEASKFTEVGYVGRDAESMVRDLVDASINMVRTEREDEVYPQAEQRADERLLDLLLPPAPPAPPAPSAVPAGGAGQRAGGGSDGPAVFVVGSGGQARAETATAAEDERRGRSREKLRQMPHEGALDDREVEIEVTPQSFPMMELIQPPQGMEGADINFTEMLQDMLPRRKKRRTVKVPEARRVLVDE